MRRRAGFSLFEVMIAMSICVAGLALILQMLGTAEMFSRRSSAGLTQQILCQNKLNQIALGLENSDDVRRLECEENPQFWYSIHSTKHFVLPLRQVEVVVWAKSPNERAGNRNRSAGVVQQSTSAKEFRLACLLPLSPQELAEESAKRSPGSEAEE